MPIQSFEEFLNEGKQFPLEVCFKTTSTQKPAFHNELISLVTKAGGRFLASGTFTIKGYRRYYFTIEGINPGMDMCDEILSFLMQAHVNEKEFIIILDDERLGGAFYPDRKSNKNDWVKD